ncbi:hypothetical protein [Streptomyces sp. NRRL S-495]|uniref:hypothetical protein n=1 Tax=Streptomyces sp. NRRL S-495 TaxID=1609133 RepID=UPI00133182C4|nr:hypothetical protein [Streptomyces sp. NRRL S-495]
MRWAMVWALCPPGADGPSVVETAIARCSHGRWSWEAEQPKNSGCWEIQSFSTSTPMP